MTMCCPDCEKEMATAAERDFDRGRAALSAELADHLRFTKFVGRLVQAPMTTQTKAILIEEVTGRQPNLEAHEGEEVWDLLQEDYGVLVHDLGAVTPV